MSVKTKKRTIVSRASKPATVKTVVTETKVTETTPVEETKVDLITQSPLQEKEPVQFDLPKVEAATVNPAQPATLNSQSMLDDLMTETDKDGDEDNYDVDDDNDLFAEGENAEPSTPGSTEKPIGEKLTDTITSDGEDWQNPTDWRKMCAVNAMMFVEGGAIFLSFIGQLISGDWSKEGETKYMPSEERRKLIRNPLAKKMEMNKNRKKSSPMGAMITAIIFTVLPIIIIAFKDRKAKIDKEIKELENIKLREELEKSNLVITQLRSNINNITPQSNPVAYKAPTGFNRVEKRGRHKKDCDCDRCNLSRMKTKGKKEKV